MRLTFARARRSLRAFIALVNVCVALAVLGVLWVPYCVAQSEERRAEAARLMNELMTGKVPVGAPFTLTGASGTHAGKRVSLSDFRGKLVLLYFGYTSCPDVCPTDLLAMSQTLKLLGPQAAQVQPLFVTLDPARDTPDVLRSYAAAFHPRLIALTGSEDEIRRVATAYKVFYEKVSYEKSSERADRYLIDHSAFTFLLDRNGQYVLFFPPGTSAERMVVMVRERLAGK